MDAPEPGQARSSRSRSTSPAHSRFLADPPSVEVTLAPLFGTSAPAISPIAPVSLSVAIAYHHPAHRSWAAPHQSGCHGPDSPNLPAYCPLAQIASTSAQFGGLPLHLRILLPQIRPPAMTRSFCPASSQVRGPLVRLVAGEGFEPSKLSRRIYSPQHATP